MPPDPPIQGRDTVWLDSRNIRTTCPSKKLNHRFLGPFLIMEKVLSHAFQLGLSLALSCIHPVFHVSLLQPTSSSEIPKRGIYPPPPIELENSNKWEVHRILDSRIDRRCKGSGLLYLVEWKGFGNTPDATSWEPPKHLTNTPNVVWASIRLIQRSQPSKFIKQGPLSYMSLRIFVQLINYSLYRFLEPLFSLFYRIRSFYLQAQPFSFHSPRHLPHCKLHFQLPS